MYTSSYKSTGERLKIEIPEDMKSQLGEESDDGSPEYILILSQTHVEAHSLHVSAEW